MATCGIAQANQAELLQKQIIRLGNAGTALADRAPPSGAAALIMPLIVPLPLLKDHLNRYPVPEWVHQRVYLHPYLKELMLRNHV